MPLKPYPQYKETGLPWLGQIPAHWEIVRAKQLFHKMSRPSSLEEEVVTCFRDGVVTLRKNRRITGFTESIKEIGYQGVRQGDLVIHSMDAFAGAIGVSDANGECTPVYAVCQPSVGVNAYYYARVTREMARSQWIAALAKGIRERSTDFRYEGFSVQDVPKPPESEQSQIADFLAHFDRRINRLIRVKRRHVELLNEQKQAIIHQAVTRGLDPNVRLRPSGIDWLGDVPEHWKVLPFTKYVIERADYRGATPEKVDNGVFLVTARNIREGWIDYETSKEYVREDQYTKIMRRGFPRLGDILLTMEAPLGHVAMVDREDVAMAQRVIRFRLNERWFIPRFAMRSMLSPYFQNQMLIRSTGSTAQGLKASKLPQLLLLQPPIEEQREILTTIDANTTGIGLSLDRARREIDLLREYRTRLIADVVTGKLDVRGVELPELDDDSELEYLDVEETSGLDGPDESPEDPDDDE